MSLDEPTRRSLYDALVDALGDAEADILMTLLPPHPLAEMATRDDLLALAVALRGEMAAGFAAMDLRFAELRGDFVELRSEVRTELSHVRGEIGAVRSEIRAVRSELLGEIGAVRSELLGEIGAVRSELLGEIGAVRGEIGALRAEMARQTLTLGILLAGLIVTLFGTMLTLGFTGAFA